MPAEPHADSAAPGRAQAPARRAKPTGVRQARRRLIGAYRRTRRRVLRAVRGEEPLLADMDGDSRTLLIALGSLSKGVEPPVFEWGRLTREYGCKRLLVRDLHQAWYQLGLPGHGDSLSEAIESLRALISAHEVERLVVIGSSSGGYAALVVGTVLGADTVLAFGPQTTLERSALAEMRDRRWDEPLEELRARDAIEQRWLDLQTALPPARWADTRYRIYFDESLPSDRRHAERLAGLAGVSLHPVGAGKHFVARGMRESGLLGEVLRDALEPPDADRAAVSSPAGVEDAAAS